MTKKKRILLWIICIPAGIAAGAIVTIIYPNLLRFVDYGGTAFLVFAVMGGLLGGCAAIYVSGLLAPSHKKWAVTALLCFYLAKGGGQLYLAYNIFQDQANTIGYDDWLYIIRIGSMILGAILMTVLVFINKIKFEYPN